MALTCRHLVEFFEIIERALLHVERLLLDKIAAAEGVDSLGNSRLERDDLLRAQRDARGFSGGQGGASS